MSVNDYLRNPADQRFLGSSVHQVAATQSDTVNEPGGISKGLLLDAAGDIKWIDETGATVGPLSNLAVGVIHPIRVKRVEDTGTTIADADIILVY